MTEEQLSTLRYNIALAISSALMQESAALRRWEIRFPRSCSTKISKDYGGFDIVYSEKRKLLFIRNSCDGLKSIKNWKIQIEKGLDNSLIYEIADYLNLIIEHSEAYFILFN